MIDVLTEICNKIWRTGKWSTPWTQFLIIELPKNSSARTKNYQLNQSLEQSHSGILLEQDSVLVLSDFRCNVLLFVVLLVIYKYRNR